MNQGQFIQSLVETCLLSFLHCVVLSFILTVGHYISNQLMCLSGQTILCVCFHPVVTPAESRSPRITPLWRTTRAMNLSFSTSIYFLLQSAITPIKKTPPAIPNLNPTQEKCFNSQSSSLPSVPLLSPPTQHLRSPRQRLSSLPMSVRLIRLSHPQLAMG